MMELVIRGKNDMPSKTPVSRNRRNIKCHFLFHNFCRIANCLENAVTLAGCSQKNKLAFTQHKSYFSVSILFKQLSLEFRVVFSSIWHEVQG